MAKIITAGSMIIVLIALLVQLYELLPAQQGWIIFTTIGAIAMSLADRHNATAGTP